MQIPPLPSASTSGLLFRSPSVYEWLRNYLAVMPLRARCWTRCWMSDAAWTEWKSYSRPRYNCVAFFPGSTPYSVFRSTTLGTKSLFASAVQQHEMSIQAQKNVARLRISKSLTCDDWNERLTYTCVSAMRRWSLSGYVTGGWPMLERTFWQLFESGSSKQLLIVSKQEII